VNTHRSSQQRVHDEEEGGFGLTHVQTENDAGPSPIEAYRRREDAQSSPGPHKAPTFPQGPSTDLPQPAVSADGAGKDEITELGHRAEGGNATAIVGVPAQLQPTLLPTEISDTQRLRVRRFLPWKHRSDEIDIGRTDASEEDDAKKFKYKPTLVSQFKATLNSWIVLLLLPFVVIGITLNYCHQSAVAVFVTNFVAIIPTNIVLMFAVEELGKYLGDKPEGLLSMTFRFVISGHG
jgi:hypothetical protein